MEDLTSEPDNMQNNEVTYDFTNLGRSQENKFTIATTELEIPEVVNSEDGDENEELIVNDSDQNIIRLGVTKDTIDTLIIQVGIKDQLQMTNRNFTAFVDTGASVSLLSYSCYQKLNPQKYKLEETPYRRVSGIGQVTFPVMGGVTLILELSSSYALQPHRLIVIPDGITEYDIVIGHDILRKEHLLPDPHEGELVCRKGNKVMAVSTDIRKISLPTYCCTLVDNVVLPPNNSTALEVSINSLMEQPGKLIVMEGDAKDKVEVSPSILNVIGNKAVIIVGNRSDTVRKLKKGQKLGKIHIINDEESLINMVELSNQEMSEKEEWTLEKLHEAFRLSESDITAQERNQVLTLLSNYHSVLSLNDSDVGCTSIIKHKIETTIEDPVQVPVRRLQGPVLKEIEESCKRLEEDGIIRRSKSPYSAPVVPIRKPDGTIRLCIDYRSLNKITKGDSFPIPNLIDMLFSLQGMKYFTTIDLVKGYYQVEMEESSIEKTAFTTPLSHWEFLRMPFGVKNGPATFQRGMRMALSHIPWTEVMVYLDDVLIISKTFEKHLEILEKVLQAFLETGFKIKPAKTFLLRKQVQYLGHQVSEEGMIPLQKNLQGIMDFPAPTTIRKVRQFLGMVNFYRRHIPRCSEIAKPLFELLNQKNLKWTSHCQTAFEELKRALVNPLLLSYPDRSSDASPLLLHVDASNIGAGACLSQIQQGENKPIAYISTTFSRAEQKYSTTEKEVAAIRWAVRSLKPFLYGIKVLIHTDHQPLLFLNNMTLVNQRVARTLEEINDIDYELVYIPGKANIVADALSRSPVPVDNGSEIKDSVLNQIPVGCVEVKMPGGGDSLFQCFSVFLYGNPDQHLNIREAVARELLENRRRYNLPTGKNHRTFTKQLQLLRYPGQLPIVQAIEAFSHLHKVRVQLYYGNSKPLQFGDLELTDTCLLLCLGGVHYNLLSRIGTQEKEPQAKIVKVDEEFEEYELLNESLEDPTPIEPEIINSEINQTESGGEVLVAKVYQLALEHEDPILDVIALTAEEIHDYQKQDPVLKQLYRAIKHNRLWGGSLKKFIRFKKYIFIKDKMLCKINKYHETTYIVPFPVFTDLAIMAHVNFAHIGKSKLISLVNRYVWHPKGYDICYDITTSCYKCQASKTSNIIYTPPTIKISTDFPFELVAMDLLQLPKTKQGNNYALVMVDHHTKWIAAVPIKNKQSFTITNTFQQLMLPYLPNIPERILTDNGREFVGPEFEEMLQLNNIKHILSTPYTPSSNGAVERINRTIIQYLRMSITDYTMWDKELPRIVLIYNHTEHSQLGLSPCEYILKEQHAPHLGLSCPGREWICFGSLGMPIFSLMISTKL